MDGIALKLERLKREARREWKKKWRKATASAPSDAAEWRALAGEVAVGILKIALIIVLPFAVLVRGAVFIHEHGETAIWVALLVSGFLTAGVITAYAVWIARKIMKRKGRHGRQLILPVAKWVALPLVVFYCGYS